MSARRAAVPPRRFPSAPPEHAHTRPARGWLREAISDDAGTADVAYVSLFVVCGAVLGTISFVCLMSAISYWRCVEVLTTTPPILCRFDPLPIGQAVGLICGGFGAALGALAGYMAATRIARTSQPAVTTATATVVTPATPGG